MDYIGNTQCEMTLKNQCKEVYNQLKKYLPNLKLGLEEGNGIYTFDSENPKRNRNYYMINIQIPTGEVDAEENELTDIYFEFV